VPRSRDPLPYIRTFAAILEARRRAYPCKNPTIIAYAEEGATNAGQTLTVVNNTFVNDKGSGTFIQLAGGASPAVVRNNIFFGGGTVTNQAAAQLSDNFSTGDPLLVDRAGFNYRLRAGSPCIDKGGDPGVAGAMSLVPVFHYVHPLGSETRRAVGALDIGAYELGASGGALPDAGTGSDATARADAGTVTPPKDAAVETATGGPPPADAGAAKDASAADRGRPGTSSSSGCSCQTGGPQDAPSPLLILGAAALVLWLHRRKRRNPSHWRWCCLAPAAPVPPVLSGNRSLRLKRRHGDRS
jgi:MYXO-CTERM domain-containing protein